MNLITDLQYFAPVILYENLDKFSYVIFDKYDRYRKMSFRNRCQVAGSGGVINLSVPLLHGRDQRALMKDVKISDRDRWQGHHWKTLSSCYSRSPWFEFYRDELEGMYRKPFTFLLDWNLACWEWSLKALGIKIAYGLSDTCNDKYDIDSWMDWRHKILPGHAVPGGREAGVDKEKGEAAGGPETTGRVKYHQVFEDRIGFQPNLSILDLLFCEGKRSAEIIYRRS